MSGALNASAISAQIEFPSSLLSATDFALSPADAMAWLQFRNDGQVYDQDSAKVGDWIIPNGAAPDDYEIKANSASPDTPDTGTMDTWLALSSARTWSVTEAGFGVELREFTIEIRKGSGPSILTRNCSIRAEVDI